jgi:hypothetical protein
LDNEHNNGGEVMHHQQLIPQLAFAVLLIATVSAYAGDPVPARREPQPPRICKNGPEAGMTCATNDDCPQGSCEINYLSGPGTAFRAEITLIVDDDVSQFDVESTNEVFSNIIAATAVLEFKHKGEKHVLAQTYQNLTGSDFDTLLTELKKGPFLADGEVSDRRIAEFRLSDALTPGVSPSLLESFLFQGGDNEMSEAIRTIFGVTGKPIVAATPEDISFVEHFDHSGEGDGLASLVRFKVEIRFVVQDDEQ